jgi:probable rRNA maturation factor
MIVVQITQDFQDIDVSLPRLKELVKIVCNRFKLKEANVGVAIVDDAQIQKLGSQFLQHQGSTDCLSFDLTDDLPNSTKSFEIIVNGERAIKEAQLQNHSSEAELALYITHSLLHNLGFDDSTDKQAKKMHKIEDEILQHFGYDLVYNKKIKS